MSALVTCGCCKGLEALTPSAIGNAPALSAIAYRTGTWATFRETMLAALATRAPALEALDPYSGDDFATALVDAWAVACDVLSFYQERVANESYLRTATERRSLLELARAIGYELGPGVAASAWLAFIIEEPPPAALAGPPGTVIGAPQRVAHIPTRSKVQSVPGPNEKAQTFETVEAIDAWPEWNTIRPLRVGPPVASRYFLSGRTGVKAGDRLLDNGSVVVTVTDVAYRAEDDVTIVQTGTPPPATNVDAFRAPTTFVGSVLDNPSLSQRQAATLIARGTWRIENLIALAALRGWDLDALTTQIRDTPRLALFKLFAFRQRAAAFGNNAPDWDALPTSLKFPGTGTAQAGQYAKWDNNTPIPNSATLDLDARYPSIAAGSFILIEEGAGQAGFTVNSIGEVSRNGFTLSARVTRLVLNGAVGVFHMRLATIYAESVALPRVDEIVTSPIAGTDLTLDGVFLRLRKGQHVVLSGAREDTPTLQATEVREIAEVTLDRGSTHLKFTEALTHRYLRRTVTLNANVAASTHGESVTEVLGNGDAGVAFQSFVLRQAPLTYVRGGNGASRGVASTLEVYVNDVRWTEVPALHGRGPNDRVYTTRMADAGAVTIRFGDGITGARVPTGEQNVRAVYRKGIGLEGLVRTDQLSLPMDRPHGVKGVTNPVPSRDAASPEQRDEARSNAPLTVLTLDRIVSIRDFEDYARAFTGVGKALATSIEGDDRRGVFVTVAGPGGLPFDPTPLTKDLRRFGDPFVSFVVQSYRRVFFRVRADVIVAEDHIPEKVFAAIESALRTRFSFEARAFGSAITRSEIIAAIQSVGGVISTNVALLDASGNPADRIRAAIPSRASDGGAELLLLDASPVELRRIV